ncbi:MAG: DUF4974 domain-containing protein [Bacteroidaceae bacterium]|nr:DUF4974 domain-containing protein [Bacteroidaceae bacterium]
MMNKTDLLFQMMEQPQAYTDQQWQDILSDEECRELYTLMSKTQSAFDAQKEIGDETIDAEWKRLTVSTSRKWLRVAAMFIGILLISGITLAAIHTWNLTTAPSPRDEEHSYTQASDTSRKSSPIPSEGEEETTVIFANVPLDTMLLEIAAYYHVSVEIEREEVRQLRFHFVWKRTDDLDHLVKKLNNFEAVNIIREPQKLIVK